MTMDALTNELTVHVFDKTEQETQYEVFEMVSWMSDVPNCFAKEMTICVDYLCSTF